QRIGGAIGTALLATIFYQVLRHSGGDYASAVSEALLCAGGFMLLALLLASAELVGRRRPVSNRLEPTPRHGGRLDQSGHMHAFDPSFTVGEK
ncbi:MAG: hypothetical protein QOJ62_2400, partial [Actinomycetota bacterium]|nr:hypothetical protein [Actinomycetota bacterium]